ncbi:MAG TPA: hypothetical protein VMW66_04945 [Elusimicrobiales bacterium]|nr:hypothetical protein [Elusimicrobiales bacterium]
MDKKPKVYIKSSRDDKVTVKKIMMERESMYVPNDAFKNVSLNHIKVFSTGRDILLSNQKLKNPARGIFDYHALFVNCKFCGSFFIRRAIKDRLINYSPEQKAKVSTYTRRQNIFKDEGHSPCITDSTTEMKFPENSFGIHIEKAIDSFPNNLDERWNNTLLNLSHIQKHLGDHIKFHPRNDYPLFFTLNTEEMNYFIKAMYEEKYLQDIKYNDKTSEKSFQLTPKAINKITELEQGKWGPLSKQVFVAMSFNAEKPELKEMFEKGIKPAIKECKYEAFRADYHHHNNLIDDVIVSNIKKSKFMVADFTENRNGVYYEAGMMKGLGREVIYTVHENDSKKVHFDVDHINRIKWKNPEDLRKKLIARIQATIN